ncbi:acetylserotonin O-methyltransferase [Roseovarius aestuariivivens]|uniref:acetylserotonin O-methyltransferase n=1 Tax=Roseovarius aestuariivivens TaxID=1888910 RepID=UPI001FD9EF63|nr:acetylserotonin O-methyltransferase [Roseovarius aestuariivivens]
MAVHEPEMPRRRVRLSGLFARLIARPDVQKIASALPFGRGMARRDGAEIFEILQGFVASQVLGTLVETGILRGLLEGAQSAEALGFGHQVPVDRMEQLLKGGVALGLLKQRRDGRFALARKGAAILGVPGLEAMIAHNREFYADMADPIALMRGEDETRLQRFWPYVFGAGGEIDPEVADRYSTLMAESQVLVARDTLAMLPVKGDVTVMDVGGGSGVFLSEVLRRNRRARGILFDLPEVMPQARARVAEFGLDARVTLAGGSFREDALPEGADVISLIRVLYDHDDDTVTALLRAVYDALPPGGRLIVSEPMAGGARPERAGDLYFAFYTMAMGTGRARSPERIAEMCRAAGFEQLRIPRAPRPYITSALSAFKPSESDGLSS